MKIFFQPFMGISGDMTVAALSHLLGLDTSQLQRKIDSWGLPIEARLREEKRGEISGLYLHLDIKDRLPEVFSQDIREIIESLKEDKEIKEAALQAFENLFKAEAEAHGVHWKRVHLHEAGAWDAIFDLLATAWLLREISPEEVLHSPVNLGEGSVETSHGRLPVPAPAVVALLRGREVFSSGPRAELTTPTGAAILKTFAKPGRLPPGKLVGEGRGLGTLKFPGYPNFLRVLGLEEGPQRGWVYEIEAQVDDTTGEILGNLWEVLEGKALDMVMLPIYMKKGRPGTLIKILARPGQIEEVMGLLFRETTTIGLRYSVKERYELEREVQEMEIEGERVQVKIAKMGGEVVNVSPEFSSCKNLAQRLKISVKEACRRILAQWREK